MSVLGGMLMVLEQEGHIIREDALAFNGILGTAM